MEPNWTKTIEQYLMGELNATQRANFEKELANSAELRQELELHKMTHQIIERATLRDLVQQGGKTYIRLRQLKISALVLAVLLVVGAGVFYAIKSKNNSETAPIEQLDDAVLKRMQSFLEFDNIAPEYFGFTGESDVFLSESGVLLSVTDASFLQNGKPYSGPAMIQWQEAQEAADIVKAGLSTTSGDKLLETQGMFSLKAFTPAGKPLDLSNSGVYVQVPVHENKEGMQLFQGVKGKDGQIDWQNPKPLERIPQAKAMHEMDLFPPDYEPKLNELMWFKEKAKRDSLYLSFDASVQNVANPAVIIKEVSNNDASLEQTEIGFEKNNRGKMLFQNYCSTCHAPHKDGTGPKLFKVRDKWASAGAKEGSIYQWVSDWSKAAAHDPYARMVSEYKPTAQSIFPSLEGKVDDINAIFDYIDGTEDPNHIPPSKVLAIWRPKFDGTILATRDFEKRMQAIHRTCNKRVFEVYTSNLNEPLCQKDERVAKMGYSEFKAFAAERVGAMKINDKHAQNLAAFYASMTEILRNKGKRAVEAAFAKDRKWDEKVEKSRNKNEIQKGIREQLNLSQEYDFNLKDVCKQLGRKVGFQMHGGGTIVNIDKYVMDATVARKSTVITDPETGKTAKIEYEHFQVEVEDASKYNKLFVYLFPTEINSFQRLDLQNGALDYALNMHMSYTGMLIGMNDQGMYVYEFGKMQAKDYGKVVLKSISNQGFDQKMDALNKARNAKPASLKDELKWLFVEQKDYQVQKKRRENEEFRTTIRPTIYPSMTKTDGIGKPIADTISM